MQQYFGVSKNESIIKLNEKDFNHIKNVMRMSKGAKVYTVFDGKRYISTLNKDLESVTVESEVIESITNNKTTIYVPFLQDEKMSYIFQKCTELGATEFVIVEYERCKYKIDAKTKEKKLIRWNKIITEASEQSYRTEVPVLNKFITPNKIESVNGMNILCSLDKENVKNLTHVLTEPNICDKISIVFGPEGGLTESEESIIESNGYIKVLLGSSVLRTETVPVFLMSIIKYLRGCE